MAVQMHHTLIMYIKRAWPISEVYFYSLSLVHLNHIWQSMLNLYCYFDSVTVSLVWMLTTVVIVYTS